MGRVKDFLTMLILPVIIIVAVIIPAVVTRNQNRQELELTCVVIRANIQELEALKRVAREIGLPGDFTVPDLPEECEEVDPIISAVLPADLPKCTVRGTREDDVIPGTREKDIICGLGGNDYIAGNGRPDILRGGDDRDVLVGGNGIDILRGNDGPDRLFAVDGKPGDRLGGGPHNDQCFIDRGDITYNCEQVFKGSSTGTIQSLEKAMYDAFIAAQPTLPPCDVPDPPPSCQEGSGGGGTGT